MSVTAHSIALTIGCTWLLVACSAAPLHEDAGVYLGIDSGVDLGRDAGRDGGQDAGQDAGGDAGPPYLPFVPRLLFSDPTVHCTPPPPLEMRPTPGPRPARGAVRWTFNPSRDPDTVAALLSFGRGGLGLTGRSMIGLANGGFVTSISLDWSFLAVNADGSFHSLQAAYGPGAAPTWVMPGTFAMRPHSSVFGVSGLLLLRDFDDTTRGFAIETAVVPAAFPGTAVGAIEGTGMTLLRDGTMVWFPTTRTMQAFCADGRTRWVLEFYNQGYALRAFGASDGTLVFATVSVGIQRIDSDGHPVESGPYRADGDVIGYSDRCGLAAQSSTGSKLFSGPNFSTVRNLPLSARPADDCGWWGGAVVDGGVQWTRYRPDGTRAFDNPGQTPSAALVELADGSWLTMSKGGLTLPGMSIIADDGTLLYDGAFDRDEVGEELSGNPATFLLTPDGVLYVTASSDFGAIQQFAAIEVGVGPKTNWAWSVTHTNWANDGAAWHPAPASASPVSRTAARR